MCGGVDFGIDRFAFLVGRFRFIFFIFGVLVGRLCLEVWLVTPSNPQYYPLNAYNAL